MNHNLYIWQLLAAQLDTSNAIRVWMEADRLSKPKLKLDCFNYILSHKQEVLRREDVDQLPADVLNTIRAHREEQDQVI